MPAPILLGKDKNGNVTYLRPIGGIIYRTTLSPSVAQNVTIPLSANSVVFSYSNGTDVWVDFSGNDATVPSGSFALATSELNPVGYEGLTPGKTLSFVSATTAYVSVTFYS